MKIELLQGSLPITENPGLDSTDPRFDEIATLIQEGKYAEAATLSENILVDGIYDIRLICYFLYGYWLEQGLASLLDVINCLNHLMLENWAAVGPVKKKEKFAQTSISWTFRQVLKKIQYEEKKKTVLWQQWQTSVSQDEIEKIIISGEAFRVNIEKQLEGNAEVVLSLWIKIESWLRALQRLVISPPEPVQPEPEIITDIKAPEKTSVAPVAPLTAHDLNIEVSYPMELLLKKLAAFERLLQEKKIFQAALVADNINQTLTSFDPLLYFPKTFEIFVRLQVRNFEELSAYENHRGSPQWQVMQDWLKTDIESFINN